MLGRKMTDVAHNFEVLFILIKACPERVMGVHVIAAALRIAHFASGELVLRDTLDSDTLAVKYAGRLKLLIQYCRALKRKTKKSRDWFVQTLKDIIVIQPYAWSLKRHFCVHAVDQHVVCCVHARLFSFRCTPAPLRKCW